MQVDEETPLLAEAQQNGLTPNGHDEQDAAPWQGNENEALKPQASIAAVVCQSIPHAHKPVVRNTMPMSRILRPLCGILVLWN